MILTFDLFDSPGDLCCSNHSMKMSIMFGHDCGPETSNARESSISLGYSILLVQCVTQFTVTMESLEYGSI